MICEKMSDSLQDETLTKANGISNGNILIGSNRNNPKSSCSC
jgi:hypothetical protein